jgi:hypothetical protein
MQAYDGYLVRSIYYHDIPVTSTMPYYLILVLALYYNKPSIDKAMHIIILNTRRRMMNESILEYINGSRVWSTQ